MSTLKISERLPQLFSYGAAKACFFVEKIAILRRWVCYFLLPMVPKFQYQRLYRLAYNDNRDAERCAWAYYSGGNDGNCSAVLPWSSAGYLDNIWRIDTFAAKEFKQMHPGEPSRYDSVPRRLSDKEVASDP